jgi:hypothetical protein
MIGVLEDWSIGGLGWLDEQNVYTICENLRNLRMGLRD